MRHVVLALILVGLSGMVPGSAPPSDARERHAAQIASKLALSVAVAEPARMDAWFERSYRACVVERRIADRSIDRASRPPANDAVRNTVRLTRRGQALWNGAVVDLVTLRQYLDITANMNPLPFLIVDVHQGAPLSLVRGIHQIVVRSGVCPGLPT